MKPEHYFRSIFEFNEEISNGLRKQEEPQFIEYFNLYSGETYKHIYGTTFWDNEAGRLNIPNLIFAGITHCRIIKPQD